MNLHLTHKSSNQKTGPIPVSTTSNETCPPACPLLGICYAQYSFLGSFWRNLTNGVQANTLTWTKFLREVRGIPDGQIWRHNQAGDLAGDGNSLDTRKLRQLVHANGRSRGFTYTHKPLTGRGDKRAIKSANAHGFTINLSANNLSHADELSELRIAPVVTLLPSDIHGKQDIHTPMGRRVVVCPATYQDNVTCQSCGLCQRQGKHGNERVIVGFPAHGSARKRTSQIARGE
jgi:hypothetical protein